jgi:hypothetical protein
MSLSIFRELTFALSEPAGHQAERGTLDPEAVPGKLAKVPENAKRMATRGLVSFPYFFASPKK